MDNRNALLQNLAKYEISYVAPDSSSEQNIKDQLKQSDLKAPALALPPQTKMSRVQTSFSRQRKSREVSCRAKSATKAGTVRKIADQPDLFAQLCLPEVSFLAL